MRKVLGNRERCRCEYPRLMTIVDQPIQCRRNVKWREIDAQATRVDLKPTQTVPGVVIFP